MWGAVGCVDVEYVGVACVGVGLESLYLFVD